jgi:hypothetical protein
MIHGSRKQGSFQAYSYFHVDDMWPAAEHELESTAQASLPQAIAYQYHHLPKYCLGNFILASADEARGSAMPVSRSSIHLKARY